MGSQSHILLRGPDLSQWPHRLPFPNQSIQVPLIQLPPLFINLILGIPQVDSQHLLSAEEDLTDSHHNLAETTSADQEESGGLDNLAQDNQLGVVHSVVPVDFLKEPEDCLRVESPATPED